MLHSLISKFDSKIDTADAHCDIPCGIYDARIVTYYAVSALRQIDILPVSYTHLTLPTTPYV